VLCLLHALDQFVILNVPCFDASLLDGFFSGLWFSRLHATIEICQTFKRLVSGLDFFVLALDCTNRLFTSGLWFDWGQI
jgi:hypothetical protein